MTQRTNSHQTDAVNYLAVGEMRREWRQARDERNEMYLQAFKGLQAFLQKLAKLKPSLMFHTSATISR